jgi:8-oxo-dGTP pyrophosphatase MutT (NUDIX family)
MRRETILQAFVSIVTSAAGSWLFFYIQHNGFTIPLIPKDYPALSGGVIFFVVAYLTFRLELPRIIGSKLHSEAMVVSALVFDQDDVLLVLEEKHLPPWLVPPSAHLKWFTNLEGGPHQAVIMEIKEEAGIDIQIDGPAGLPVRRGRGAWRLPQPCIVQSEHQFEGEGHEVHHDFYYIGHLRGEREVRKPIGKYEWVNVDTLDRVEIPHEMVKVIGDAFKERQIVG